MADPVRARMTRSLHWAKETTSRITGPDPASSVLQKKCLLE
jgi:hypothetical protein